MNRPKSKELKRSYPAPAVTDSAETIADLDAPVLTDSAYDEADVQLPELPDEYLPPEPGAEFVIATLPGYHASLWNDNDSGFAKMKSKGVVPADGDCPFIPEWERRRLSRGHSHGFLTYGDLVVGIETINHYTGRYKATVSDPADEQLNNLPVAPEGATKGEQRVTYGTTRVIAPQRAN